MTTTSASHIKHQQTGWKIMEAITSHLKAGINEQEATDIANQVFEDFGITQMWHPLCIKFDNHTLKPGIKHRPNRETKLHNIAIVDIGIVIDNHEVDCGITIGLQNNTKKLANASKDVFEKIKKMIESNPKISPKEIFEKIQYHAKLAGNFTQIAPTAGHALGVYPTPKRNPKIALEESASELSKGGWMIEIHISDGEFGAFYEDFIWID